MLFMRFCVVLCYNNVCFILAILLQPTTTRMYKSNTGGKKWETKVVATECNVEWKHEEPKDREMELFERAKNTTDSSECMEMAHGVLKDSPLDKL